MVLLAGCVVERGPVSSDDPGGWSFPGDPIGGPTQNHCKSDSACTGGDVCARDGGCWPASQVHAVHVSWTMRGMPANQTTCAAALDLQIGFYVSSDARDLGYAPVPCVQGKFTVDKLPTSYTGVRLGLANGDHRWQATTLDGVTGEATLDLPF